MAALLLLAGCSAPETSLSPAAMTGPDPSTLHLRAEPGGRASGVFEIGNGGPGPLTIALGASEPWLRVEGPSRHGLAAGEAARVRVSALCAALPDERLRSGSVAIAGDDPRRPLEHVLVRLTCAEEASDPGGEPAPEEGGNLPPRAAFAADPPSGSLAAPAQVTFSASASGDADGTIVRYAWIIEGERYEGVTATHDFAAGGAQPIELTVTDDEGASDTLLSWYRLGEGEVAPDDPVEPEEPAPEEGFAVGFRFYGSRLPSDAQRRVFRDAADRWGRAIVGDLPDVSVDLPANGCFGMGEPAHRGVVDDVLIFAAVVPIDGAGGVLASAGACILRNDSGLPLVGLMEFDEADFASLADRGLLFDTVLHEMGHVLGIGTLWETAGRDLVDSDGPSCDAGDVDARFTGAEATRQHERIGGVGRPRVETDGGAGTACGHWDEVAYAGELMTGWIGGGMELSAMTVGGLADLGYEVDVGAADAYRVPDAGLRSRAAGEPLGEILLRPTRTLP